MQPKQRVERRWPSRRPRPETAQSTTPRSRLGIALDGFRLALRTDAGVRNQVFGFVAMLACLGIFQPSAGWWGACLCASALLVALELVNTAIERLVDMIEPRPNPAAGSVKDIAAAAVIVASLGTAALGIAMILVTTNVFN